MDFNEYKEEAMRTNLAWQLPKNCDPLLYFSLKLCGESGEIAEKVGKLFRDREGKIDKEWVIEIEKELGDCFWYLAALADDLGISLNRVAYMNLKKLKSRQERGVLGGSGDNR